MTLSKIKQVSIENASSYDSDEILVKANGFIMDINGLTSGSTNAFYDHDGTGGGDTVGGWLKIRVNGATYYIGLYDATH